MIKTQSKNIHYTQCLATAAERELLLIQGVLFNRKITETGTEPRFFYHQRTETGTEMKFLELHSSSVMIEFGKRLRY